MNSTMLRLFGVVIIFTSMPWLLPDTSLAEDCNGNGAADNLDISRGTSQDCNANAVPDECDLSGVRFDAIAYYPVPRGAFIIRSADVDRDGDMDLVVIGGQGCDNMSVLLNQGDGTFSGPTDYTVPGWPACLAVADLTGDGYADIVVGSDAGTSIFPNNGNGTFGARRDSSTQRTREVAAGDLDSDGDRDLVIVSWNYGYEVAKVRVWTNGGGGAFSEVIHNVGNSLEGLELADLDEDGDLDIVVGDGKAACSCIRILLNHGNGTFAPAFDRTTGGVTYRLASADMDHDGDVDLLLAKDSYRFTLLLNNGNATFADTSDRSLPALPYWIEPGDLDRDGDIDVITPNRDSLALLANRGNAVLNASLGFNIYSPPSGDNPTGLVMADLDNDGWPDLATANSESDDVAVLLNRSVLPASRDWNRNGVPDECEACVKTRDWDNDGDVDAEDLQSFVLCATGPVIPMQAGCGGKDLDCDDDVDLVDFAALQRCLTPSGPIDPSCGT